MADDYTVIPQIDVFATSDQELLDLLQQRTALYDAEKLARGWERLPVNAHLVGLAPSELPSCFLMSGDVMNQLEIRQHDRCDGCWGSFLFEPSPLYAVRSSAGPGYTGVRQTSMFRNRDKSEWIMIQYKLLEPKDEGRDLFLQDELMLCVVYRRRNKREIMSQIPDHLDPLFRFLCHEEFDTDGPLSPVREEQLNRRISSLSECFNGQNQGHGVGLQPKTKRPRSTGPDGKSDIWRNFTKIYVRDDSGEHGKFKLAYAVCHICDKLLKAPSKNGTKTLWRHHETCSCKQVKQRTQQQGRCSASVVPDYSRARCPSSI